MLEANTNIALDAWVHDGFSSMVYQKHFNFNLKKVAHFSLYLMMTAFMWNSSQLDIVPIKFGLETKLKPLGYAHLRTSLIELVISQSFEFAQLNSAVLPCYFNIFQIFFLAFTRKQLNT